MPTLLERIAQTRQERAAAEAEFRAALKAARPHHTWEQIAEPAGLSAAGVRYLCGALKRTTKGENKP